MASGYGVAGKGCLPCSGVSRKAVALSPCFLNGDLRIHSQVKIGSLKCFSREASFVCRAGSNGHRRNQYFSKQKHGFRGRDKQNVDRESFETFNESEPLASNGSLLSLSSFPKFQPTAVPATREMESMELFRKVQAQLHERAAAKEDKKIETSQGKGKESETVDSLLKLLRKHSVEQGKRKDSCGSRGDHNLGHREDNGFYNEDKSSRFFDTNRYTRNETKEPHSCSLSRPASHFRRKSPVPQVKCQSIYSSEDTVDSMSQLNSNWKSKLSSVESHSESKYESVSESDIEEELDSKDEAELESESIYQDSNVFDEVLEAGTSDINDADSDVGEDQKNDVEHEDLSALKLTELRALAKSHGLKGYSKMNKGDLLVLLSSGHSN